MRKVYKIREENKTLDPTLPQFIKEFESLMEDYNLMSGISNNGEYDSEMKIYIGGKHT